MKLKLNGVKKQFEGVRGTVKAVHDVTLEVADGELFVLLGPSGCGKSTLLNLVAGLERPSSGDIWFSDRLVASAGRRVFLSPRERNVAMVFQSYALYPHMTVYENIAFPLRLMKEKPGAIDDAVQQVGAMLDMEHLLTARPAELSGGQRQRVAIARAIVRQPEIFLLDEPLSNLDAQLRAATRSELKTLQRRLGITTLYVTHDQAEALSLGDRVAVLKDGRLEQVGSPGELYDKPVNAFVAQFLVSPPMNLIPAVLREEGGDLWAMLADQRLRIPRAKADTLPAGGSRECLLGLRPEQLSHPAEGSDQVLRGRVVSVERLGRETLIHTVMGAARISLLAATPRALTATPEEDIVIGVDMGKAQFFAATGGCESLL